MLLLLVRCGQYKGFAAERQSMHARMSKVILVSLTYRAIPEEEAEQTRALTCKITELQTFAHLFLTVTAIAPNAQSTALHSKIHKVR